SRIALMVSVPAILTWMAALPPRTSLVAAVPSPVRLYPAALNVRVPTLIGAANCTAPPVPVNTAVSPVELGHAASGFGVPSHQSRELVSHTPLPPRPTPVVLLSLDGLPSASQK